MSSQSSAFRVYSANFEANKATTSWTNLYDSGYVWNDSKNDRTGAWRPLFASDFQAPNISISGVTLAVDQLEDIGTSGVQFQAAISGQTATLVTEATNRWKKVNSSGYVSSFSPLANGALVSKILGYSNTATIPSFILVFDRPTVPATGSAPDFVCATQPNNFFLNLAEAGVQFNSGLTLVNSSSPVVYVPYGQSDFTCSAIWK